MHKLIVSLFLILVSVSCSTSAKHPENPGYEPSAETETITLMGTNDVHGAIAPMALKTREPNGVEPIGYEAGGVAYLGAYIKKLRSELGDRFLWLDAGDEFQGTIESNSNRGAAMVQFFNTAGLNAAAVGNHEFDFGAEPPGAMDRLSALKNRMTEARYTYLAANIYDKLSGDLASFPNTLPSRIFQVGKLKVGVIGLSTVSTPTTTRAENVVSLKFGNQAKATLREAKALRAAGAQIVLITAHAGLSCDLNHSQPGQLMRKPTDAQGECESGPSNEIVHLLKALPPGTVDAVVSGHTHTVVHHWIEGVPVIQGGANGRYFNLVHLTYDLKKHELIPGATRIEGPVPVCPMVFRNQADCNGDRPAPSIGRGSLIRPVFHGQEIKRDSAVQTAIQPAIDAADKIKTEKFGSAARPIEHERFAESPMGDLVADAVRDATHADFALVNSGGIRAPFEQGDIHYGDIFRTLPFDNNLVVLQVTGKQLKQILRIGENGARGFHPLSGLQVRLIARDRDAPADDLNQDGKIEPWEINRLLEVLEMDGTPIDDLKEYRLATIDFLVTGGDDYGWIMSQIPDLNKRTTGILVRDAAAAYIRKLSSEQGELNSIDHPIVSASHPRLVFERPKLTKTKKIRHRKRRKRSAG